ncbi:erythromycin esterase family protein [Pedomonas mirosovicensis]|uniref:erythromycin esterase family protein n=1 Tax=Pedomonas mirosovicensis TaxID=2908641 RepID=UPI0021682997|nr:erythromycin esterase family protein [Pedomonas mirosovicensis]MCH8686043.1 erythromycin esterase family protein [Pedomonas mirosovicensis]
MVLVADKQVQERLAELAEALSHAGEALPDLADPAFGALFSRLGGKRVVALGEATHGTSEFYRARAAITRHLIENHGFNIVAVEADWPDAARIDDFVRHCARAPTLRHAFTRFPTWMWRNAEVDDFIRWLHCHNAGLPEQERVEFRGLDVYSLSASIEAVLEYLEANDAEGAREARRRYGCLNPWQEEPERYGHAVMVGRKSSCEEAVVEQLQALLEARLDNLRQDGEAFFDAAQNARIVRAAEQYYRIMYLGSAESWNLRDRHMFDTLQRLLEARGPDARAIVWAHNSHIGNASATSMGWRGEFNIGELCRTAFGNACALVGFGTDRGTVAAADDWGEPMRIKNVRPARPDSYEAAFREARIPVSLTDWGLSGNRALRDVLSQERLGRAIGVIYRPETELASHYYDAVMADQFDAFVWFEETRAVTPLPTGRPHGMPDTYPFGV